MNNSDTAMNLYIMKLIRSAKTLTRTKHSERVSSRVTSKLNPIPNLFTAPLRLIVGNKRQEFRGTDGTIRRYKS